MGGHLAVADLAGLVTADGLLDVDEAGATMLATPRGLSRSEGRRRGGCHQEKGRQHPKLAFLRVTRIRCRARDHDVVTKLLRSCKFNGSFNGDLTLCSPSLPFS